MIMIITADTNVIFSALYSSSGASHYILRLILKEKIRLALSPQIYFEYYDVLTRKENLAKLNQRFRRRGTEKLRLQGCHAQRFLHHVEGEK